MRSRHRSLIDPVSASEVMPQSAPSLGVRDTIPSVPPYASSGSSSPSSSMVSRQMRRTSWEERRQVTLESEACTATLAQHGIDVKDWGASKARSDTQTTTAKASSCLGSRSGNEVRQTGHDYTTVEIPRRPLPGHQMGMTYVRYYRTGQADPAMRA